jgi:hypothetical protein
MGTLLRNRWVLLMLTFLFDPAGLLLYLVIRRMAPENRARVLAT